MTDLRPSTPQVAGSVSSRLAFAAPLRAYGAPDEVLSNSGKQITDRFGKGGKVLFDHICRENAIAHHLTLPRSPTTTGKIEHFHQTLHRELLDDAGPFADLAARAGHHERAGRGRGLVQTERNGRVARGAATAQAASDQ